MMITHLHDSVFPFTHDVDPHTQQRWVDLMVYCQVVEDAVTSKGITCSNFDLAVLSLRLLEELCHINPANNFFVDGYSNGGAVAIAALKFGYEKVCCLEISKFSAHVAKSLNQKMNDKADNARRLQIITGSIQDYLPTETSVLFLNCCELQPFDGVIDEGTLVSNVLNVTKLILLPGSTIVVLTKYLLLDDVSLNLMGIDQTVRLIYSVQKSVDVACHIWILRSQ